MRGVTSPSGSGLDLPADCLVGNARPLAVIHESGAELGGLGMGDGLSDELRPQLLGQVVAHAREHDETRPGTAPAVTRPPST